MIETIRQGLKEDGFTVSISKLCQWFGIARRTVYYKPTKAAPRVKPELAEPIKAMIEQSPSFGYRTVAYLLGMNKNTVQRIFQLKGWQVKKRAIGFRPASKPCLQWRVRRMNAGQPICAAFGPAVMVGQPWRWLSTAIRANCSAGTYHAAARLQPLAAPWSTP